jgi:hypothetical protein
MECRVKKLNPLFIILISACFSVAQGVNASVPINKNEMKNVNKAAVESDTDKERLSIAAGMLANYEIESKKLLEMVAAADKMDDAIQQQTEQLISLSENVIESARFRLPQCEDYLEKSLVLKNKLKDISHETLEKDYHHDGALPKAPTECYHTKDLFVHPATVVVLTRDDPNLSAETKESIKAEILEVLGHTEVVRQLVIY